MRDTLWRMKPNRVKALMLAKRQLSELVCDAVNLEGINYTLPEIQTLLDGVTVGGHQLAEQHIAVNQAQAWRTLFHWLEHHQFALTMDQACQLHAIAAKDEALAWGAFRSGAVTIAGTDYQPPAAATLPGLFTRMAEETRLMPDVYDQAISIFLTMARCQFFYDVNKRMGRFMMNGWLLDAGLPAINLPAKRQLEFNRLMLAFYPSGDQTPMNGFLRSCLDERLIAIMRE
jgi:Fic family protein